MKTKEFFKQIRREYKEIQHLEEAIERQHMKLLPQAIRYDKDHVQVSPEDTISETLAAIADQANKLEKLKFALEIRRCRAYDMIAALTRSDEREVMRLYYMEPKMNGSLRKWKDVAEDMGYSVQNIYILHGDALISMGVDMEP